MNEVELLTQACQLAERQVAAAVDTPTAQTACRDFTATQLVSHMVAALDFNVAILTGTPSDANPFDAAPVAPGEMLAEYQRASSALVAAASADGALENMVQHPASPDPIPTSAAIMFPTFDMYVHSWDLEQATGLAGDYPAELHGVVDGWCQQVFAGERQPGVVDPAVDAPANATPIQTLAAFLGRPS